MVAVFNYSLLPWRTVRENIALAVNSVMKELLRASAKELSSSILIWVVGCAGLPINLASTVVGWHETAGSVLMPVIRPQTFLMNLLEHWIL